MSSARERERLAENLTFGHRLIGGGQEQRVCFPLLHLDETAVNVVTSIRLPLRVDRSEHNVLCYAGDQ